MYTGIDGYQLVWTRKFYFHSFIHSLIPSKILKYSQIKTGLVAQPVPASGHVYLLITSFNEPLQFDTFPVLDKATKRANSTVPSVRKKDQVRIL